MGLAAIYVYSAYFSGDTEPLLSEGSGSPASEELLLTLGSLTSLKLNPAVFSDPVFQSLTDFGVTIPPQPFGRRNPFAPPGR